MIFAKNTFLNLEPTKVHIKNVETLYMLSELNTKKIKHIKVKKIASDYWKFYTKIVPKEKHIQSKAETFTVEGHNSLFRHFLASMRRKSKCYTKCIKMLEISLLLLMRHRNKTLSIFN